MLQAKLKFAPGEARISFRWSYY